MQCVPSQCSSTLIEILFNVVLQDKGVINTHSERETRCFINREGILTLSNAPKRSPLNKDFALEFIGNVNWSAFEFCRECKNTDLTVVCKSNHEDPSKSPVKIVCKKCGFQCKKIQYFKPK